MSSSTVFTCDRCGSSDTDDAGWALFSYIDDEKDPWDLCPSCALVVTLPTPAKGCGCGKDWCPVR